VVATLEDRLGSVVVVLETVYRRHNASAILRSAECLGLHEVHLVANGFRPSKGAARGSERWLDVHQHEDTATCIQALKDRGFSVWAADLHPAAVTPGDVPLDGPIAVLMGAELTGVSDVARSLVDGFVSVPMRGMTESLNVSVAAACILSCLADRRRDVVGGGDLAEAQKSAFLSAWIERETAASTGRAARGGLQAGATSGKAEIKR